ncbi:MAG: hypothetical protein HYY63_03370, partial [Elusimicrobia bacterium]|nr:hypothetical protein [Elusimicrobiota bacterium]
GSHSLSEGSVDSVVTYSYDPKKGILTGVVNTTPGGTVMDDGLGNKTTSKSTQVYEILNGQAKVKTVTSHTDIVNVDGSRNVDSMTGSDGVVRNSQDSVMTYNYNRETGALEGAVNTQNGITIMDDGLGNLTVNESKQMFEIINGQAKVVKNLSSTYSENIDGSKSWMGVDGKGSVLTVTYEYYGQEFVSADGNTVIKHPVNNGEKKYKGALAYARGSGSSIGDDGFENITSAAIVQTYAILNGQAKIAANSTASFTKNVDGSWSAMGITPELQAELESAQAEYGAALVDLEEAKREGVHYNPPDLNRLPGESGDGFKAGGGIPGKGGDKQRIGIPEREIGVPGRNGDRFRVGFPGEGIAHIARTERKLDQAKQKLAAIENKMARANASQALTVTYHYDANGKLNQQAADGHGMSVTDDGFGNVTTADLTQKYLNVNGQAKMIQSVTASLTENLDGSKNYMGWKVGVSADGRELIEGTAMVVNYRYEGGRLEQRLREGGNRQQAPPTVTSETYGEQTFKFLDSGELIRGEITLDGLAYLILEDESGHLAAQYRDDAGMVHTVEVSLTQNGSEISMTIQRDDSMSILVSLDRAGGNMVISEGTSGIVKTQDGRTSSEESVTTRVFDGTGRLIAASGSGVSVSDDGFGNRTVSTITQNYLILNGQAKLTSVRTHTEVFNLDGSGTVAGLGQDSVVTYTYGDRDGKKGILIGAVNTIPGVTVMDDGFGNRITSRTTQTYEIVNGQAKVKTVTTHTDSANIDGSRSVVEGSVDSVVTYLYGDQDGKKGILVGATNTTPGVTVMDDGFGNRSTSKTSQMFELINGQAKVRTVTTHTDIVNSDGSRSLADGAVDSVVTYTYGDQDGKRGVLVAAVNTTPGVTVMDDGFGNRTTSKTLQTFDIVNGQAKVKTIANHSDIVNLDGSHSAADGSIDSVVTYTYGDRDGKKGILIGAVNTVPGVTVMDDGFGNRTTSKTTQTYEIVNGQAKVKTVSTHTDIVNLDGSHSLANGSTDGVVTYTYGDKDGKKGVLIGAVNTTPGVTVMDDGFGNLSTSQSAQIYAILNGQAKVVSSVTKSFSENGDGSKSWTGLGGSGTDGDEVEFNGETIRTQAAVMTYEYEANGKLKRVSATDAVTVSDDGFGNKTKTTVQQTFSDPNLTGGQAKVIESTSLTHTVNSDSSWSRMDGTEVEMDGKAILTEGIRVRNLYDVVNYKGRLIGTVQRGTGISVSDDGFGNKTLSLTKQTFTNPALYGGQSKIATSESSSYTINLDGSWSVTGLDALNLIHPEIVETMRDEAREAQSQLESESPALEQAIGSLTEQINSLISDIEAAETAYQSEVAAAEATYQSELARLDAALQGDLAISQETYDAELAAARSAYDAVVNPAKATLDNIKRVAATALVDAIQNADREGATETDIYYAFMNARDAVLDAGYDENSDDYDAFNLAMASQWNDLWTAYQAAEDGFTAEVAQAVADRILALNDAYTKYTADYQAALDKYYGAANPAYDAYVTAFAQAGADYETALELAWDAYLAEWNAAGTAYTETESAAWQAYVDEFNDAQADYVTAESAAYYSYVDQYNALFAAATYVDNGVTYWKSATHQANFQVYSASAYAAYQTSNTALVGTRNERQRVAGSSYQSIESAARSARDSRQNAATGVYQGIVGTATTQGSALSALLA